MKYSPLPTFNYGWDTLPKTPAGHVANGENRATGDVDFLQFVAGETADCVAI